MYKISCIYTYLDLPCKIVHFFNDVNIRNMFLHTFDMAHSTQVQDSCCNVFFGVFFFGWIFLNVFLRAKILTLETITHTNYNRRIDKFEGQISTRDTTPSGFRVP